MIARKLFPILEEGERDKQRLFERNRIIDALIEQGRTEEADSIEDDYLLRIAERLGEEWNDVGPESH